MRPLELRIRNFRSYGGKEAKFDFRDRTLVGIVGPIGSGKSSILDAISFALYGKTPTIAAATKGLIHQRSADATVALRFEVEGEVWEAVRMLRVKGQSQHALYRLEEDTADAVPVEKITLESDVNSRVVELLGLEFDAFGRSVLLAQGRFAEFLRSRPAERDKVLKGVFGHDRIDAMREIAKTHSDATAVELEKLSVRVDELDKVSLRLDERRITARRLTERLEILHKAKPQLDDLRTQSATATAAAAAADARLKEITDLADRVPEQSATERLIADALGAAAKRAKLAEDLDAAQSAASMADRRLGDIEDAGTAATLDAAAKQLATVSPLERAVRNAGGRADDARTRREAHNVNLETARRRVKTAEAGAAAAHENTVARNVELDRAEASLLELRHADMATTLRRELHDGDTCPVCAQEVTLVPSIEDAADVAAAEALVVDKRAGRDRAEAAHTGAVAEVQGATEALQGLEREVERLDGEVANAETALATATDDRDAAIAKLRDLLGDGDPSELLDARKRVLEDARQRAADARKELDRVRSNHDASIREQQELTRRLSALRVDLTDLAARLDVPVAPKDDSPESIRDALDDLRSAWSDVTQELGAAKDDALRDHAAAMTRHAELMDEIDGGEDLSATIGAVSAEADLVEKSIAEDTAALEQSAELLQRRDALLGQRDRYNQIASDLTDSRFVRYLLDDERTRLAELGSEHFERLSSGRYRFSEDGKFEILDMTAAEAVRKSDSLSGGETFLASLALALALAEMVARTGGRLDAFFLDEGFGSLDPEHLDLAMDGIEALVADGAGRLVVVVSHVPELRDRIEDLIVLDRNPVTGDTRVLSA